MCRPEGRKIKHNLRRNEAELKEEGGENAFCTHTSNLSPVIKSDQIARMFTTTHPDLYDSSAIGTVFSGQASRVFPGVPGNLTVDDFDECGSLDNIGKFA